MNSIILSGVPFLYLAAFLAYLTMMITGNDRYARLGFMAAAAGLSVHTLGVAVRWIESYQVGYGHVPLANLYESAVFFAWTMVLFSLLVEHYKKMRSVSAFTMPAAALLLAWASFSPDIQDRIQPLIPALKSNWLVIHVLTCFLGYAAFFLASVLAVLSFLDKRSARAEIMERRLELTHRMIQVGFLLFSMGILTGAVWAHYAWGSYWSWDPKETWALITWLVYAAALHVRGLERQHGMAALAIVGLACVLFTYLGVNYLPGLHSYM